MKTVVVTSDFEANIDSIWHKLRDVDTLKEICRPKASFISCGNSLLHWEEGRSFVFKMYLYGFIPLGKHTINVIEMSPATHEIYTNEHNKMVPTWNHRIKMERISENVTRYTDIIDLYAGIFTPLVAWWAVRFYRHRQRKWQKIISAVIRLKGSAQKNS